MPAALRVATRGSALARWQAERVVDLLDADAELVVVSTRGDQSPDVPIHSMGGTGVFAREVQEAVLRGDADVAVHSAKDLPPDTPDGLVLAAFPERGDARDAMVGSTLEGVPAGGRVATGSVRRRAQLAHLRSDLTFAELRGNIPTRLEKAAAFDAIVVAAAALDRLGLADRIAERLAPGACLPQVAQGALAVECRADDEQAHGLLTGIDDAAVRAAVTAERAFLARLGGGCNLPCGALARPESQGDSIALEVMLASLDGHIVLRARDAGADADALGADLADRLLDREGGRMLLDDSSVPASNVLASSESKNSTPATPRPLGGRQ